MTRLCAGTCPWHGAWNPISKGGRHFRRKYDARLQPSVAARWSAGVRFESVQKKISWN